MSENKRDYSGTSTDVEKSLAEKKVQTESAIKTAVGLSVTQTAQDGIKQVAIAYTKPNTYTGNRHLYDSGVAKQRVKADSFAQGTQVKDPYTGQSLELRKADAKLKYGADWQDHLAEGDHVVPIEKVFQKGKDNPWLRNEDIRDTANSDENLQTVSRAFNNAKRSKTNEEFVTDDEYLEKTGIDLSPDGKQAAIVAGKRAQAAIDRQFAQTAFENAIKTGHEAGMIGAQNAGVTAATMSSLMNIVSVINGEKDIDEALADTAVTTGKAVATGYVMNGGLVTVSHTLSNTAPFLEKLMNSQIPGRIITAVLATGDTLRRFGNGEITAQQCIIELGEKGLNLATAGFAAAVGQSIIPIPVVGAAVGALVGTIVTSGFYHQLIDKLQKREYEHQERIRLIAQCDAAAAAERAFREELEFYLAEYFKDCQHCFDEALSEIQYSFYSGDADGVILGANQITKKLNGGVRYETVSQFKRFLNDPTVDTL